MTNWTRETGKSFNVQRTSPGKVRNWYNPYAQSWAGQRKENSCNGPTPDSFTL